MKKCPFCAEDIQEEAIKCKHCGSDLKEVSSKIPEVGDSVGIKNDTQPVKNSVGNKTVLKWIGIVLLVLLGLAFWYVSIPVLTVWYLFKKNQKLSIKNKIIVSAVVSIVFLVLGAFFLHDGRAPVLTIPTPETGYSVQASTTTIVGTVDPSDAELSVNGAAVAVVGDGSFSYEAHLSEESNQFTVEAKNGDKTTSATIAITRVFTEQEKAEREAHAEQARIAKEEQRVTLAKERLQREIDSLDKGVDTSTYRDEVISLQLEIAMFGAWAAIIKESKEDKNEEVVALVNQLERKVSAFQVKEFPLIRQNYAETLAKKMWENNVEVESLGGSHKTIQFTGGVFANNANKAEIQQTISELLKQFRFTRVNYKWYEYDDTYTYYEIESLPDSEVALIE